jgi:TRAP-type C4-dicarboxylate transport system substrate-binding protein
MLQFNKCMLGVAAAAILLAATPSFAAMTLRAGSVLPPNSDQGQAADFFAQRVNELSGGEITVEVFHSGELGSPPTQFENAIAGAQDLVIDTLDYFKSYDDRFGVINTPFVFRSRDHFRKFLNSDAFAEIAEAVESRGLVFLGSYNWMRQQDRGILSRTPIFTPEDLQGYKMRMFQAEMPIQAWSGMGANIQVMAWADVYTALATGAVDSLTTVVSASYLNKHIEVLKYFTNLKEYFQIVLPVISKRTWEQLSDEQKAIMHQAANEAGEVYVRISRENDLGHIQAAQDDLGLTIILPPLGPWHEHAKAVHSSLEEKGLLPAGIIAKAKAIQ